MKLLYHSAVHQLTIENTRLIHVVNIFQQVYTCVSEIVLLFGENPQAVE